jgi:N-acetylmuramoyl-L-alanine amidase
MYAPVGQRSTDSWGTRQDDHLAEVQPGDHGIPWSNVLAHAVAQSLHRSLRTEDLGERIRHLAVLRYLNCPGILVEPVFITNDAEAVRAADPAFRQQVAEGLAAGLRDYAAQLAALNPAPPSAGWTAPRRS